MRHCVHPFEVNVSILPYWLIFGKWLWLVELREERENSLEIAKVLGHCRHENALAEQATLWLALRSRKFTDIMAP